MAITAPVLYSERLYGEATYSSTLDAQTLSVVLSDTATLSDSLADSITKVLADVATITDILITTTGTKRLSESVSMAEVTAFSAHHLFEDTMILIDSTHLTGIKSLSDFILLNEWLSVKLNRANIWTTQSAALSTESDLTIYAEPQYSVPLYSGDSATVWVTPSQDSAAWTAPDPSSAASDLPLYAEILYGESMYGGEAEQTWIEPVVVEEETFTNFNGEGNVP